MVDFLASSVDIAFIILALLVVYNQPTTTNPTFNSEKEITVPPPQGFIDSSSEVLSPRPSPGYLAPGNTGGLVPAIKITPSSLPNSNGNGNKLSKIPLPGAGGAKGRHKKKTVSFSLSSMDDLLPHNESGVSSSTLLSKKFRPPTPFFVNGNTSTKNKSPDTPRSPSPPNLEISPILKSPLREYSTPTPSPSIKIGGFQDGKTDEEREKEREEQLGLNRELEQIELDHGILKEDSMGTQKKWLITGSN